MLKAENDALKSIIALAPGNIYWRGIDGKYLGCNISQAHALGLKTPDEIIGKVAGQIADADTAAAVDEIDFEVMNLGKERTIEEPIRDLKGNIEYYISSKRPLYNKEGKVIGLLGSSMNITAHKKAQELLKVAKKKAEDAARAKTQFLSMISHEIRIPLTSVLGFIHFLKNKNLPAAEYDEYLKNISYSSDYLLSLINNVLDYSKLEAKKFKLVSLPFNLKTTADSVIGIMSANSKAKHILLKLEYDETLPTEFIGDQNAIKQILINLLGNALKFTEQGEVTLIISNVNTLSDYSEINISVTDTGVGISGDAIKHIFKRFHQLEDTYTRSRSLTGTGLGLSIVKRLVSLLGGKIKVKSSLGKGSTFYFTFKLLRNTVESYQQNTHLSKSGQVSFPNNVLLLEDDKMIQFIHKKMLENLGCEVTTMDCAQEVLKKFNLDPQIMHKKNKQAEKLSVPFDILFVDIGLPDMDGFKLIKLMRKSGVTVPIVALTGFSEVAEQKRCLRVGADQVLIKPVAQTTLEETLRKHY